MAHGKNHEPIHPETNTLKRCAAATGAIPASQQTKLLDEFCQVTGHERKYASKLLSSRRGHVPDGTTPPNRGGRPKTYDAEVVGVLFEIWRHSEQPCGKRLVPMLGDWLPFYEKHRGELKVATREAILKISPAQVDRVLASKKISRAAVNGGRRKPTRQSKPSCRSGRNAGMLTSPVGSKPTPSPTAAATWAGSFWTLTATDIYSGWTEVRSSWNRGPAQRLHGLRRNRAVPALCDPRSRYRQRRRVFELSPAPPLHGTGEARSDDPFPVPTTRTTRRMWSRRTRPTCVSSWGMSGSATTFW